MAPAPPRRSQSQDTRLQLFASLEPGADAALANEVEQLVRDAVRFADTMREQGGAGRGCQIR